MFLTADFLAQFVQQRPCLLQIRRIELLSEPAIDWGEQVKGLDGFVLRLQQVDEAGLPCLIVGWRWRQMLTTEVPRLSS